MSADKLILEWVEECEKCHGTGVYVGMGERDGAAVVCHNCDGTGREERRHVYREFTGRKIRDDVKRVFQSGHGYCISANDVVTEEGELLPFSTAGANYVAWLNGKKPKEIEFLVCPLRANQSKNRIERCPNLVGMMISDCQHYPDKETCWKILRGEK